MAQEVEGIKLFLLKSNQNGYFCVYLYSKICDMNIYNKSTLSRFADQHADTKRELGLWYNDVTAMRWAKPSDVTKDYTDARTVANNRVIFKIRKDYYRLIVEMNYTKGYALIVFLDTHAEYDKIDAETVIQFRPKKNTKQMKK